MQVSSQALPVNTLKSVQTTRAASLTFSVTLRRRRRGRRCDRCFLLAKKEVDHYHSGQDYYYQAGLHLREERKNAHSSRRVRELYHCKLGG
jgi:hypothetical protein